MSVKIKVAHHMSVRNKVANHMSAKNKDTKTIYISDRLEEIAIMFGTATINISNGFDDGTGVGEEFFTDAPFGGEEENPVIGDEEDTSSDTSQPFPLPPDIFAEVLKLHFIISNDTSQSFNHPLDEKYICILLI